VSATAIRDGQVLETTMNAVIIYDDSAIAAKANAMLDRAARRADEALLWSVKPWKFDLLLRPPTADAALEDAEEAHLIVLAVRSQTEMSPWLLDWLEQWARRRQIEDAALAVFDGGKGDTLSAAASPILSQFAERHGLSFIFSDMRPTRDESASFLDELHMRAVATTPTLHQILEERSYDYYRGWGINE